MTVQLHIEVEMANGKRRASRKLQQLRGTQRYLPMQRTEEEALTEALIALASEYGRHDYRRITALLQARGWDADRDRVQPIWQRERLKVAQKQRAQMRLWLNDGSCARLRPERANQVWLRLRERDDSRLKYAADVDTDR